MKTTSNNKMQTEKKNLSYSNSKITNSILFGEITPVYLKYSANNSEDK